MPRLRTIQTNFSSGEIDPLMHFRSDTGAYQNGAKSLTNAILYSTGGAASRPSTRHLATLNGLSRLVTFDFSEAERYILAFQNARLDVYDLDGVLLTSITTGCNWTTATLREFTYTQRADTMIVAHRDWAPQIVKRTGLSTFVVEDFAFAESSTGDKIYQPYFKFVDDNVTISLAATTGTGIVCTSNATVFTADMVGQRILWKEVELLVVGFTSTTKITVDILGTAEGEYDLDPFKTTDGSSTVEVTHVGHGFTTGNVITITGASATGGITGANLNGSHTITTIDDNRYSFVAGGAATSSEDGGGPSVKFTGANLPTRDWAEQVFCERNGYPGAVAFHNARLWFAGTGGIPDGVWSSKLFQYFNFDVGDGSSADSIQYTIGADDLSEIRHLVSNDDLQIFTATGEFYAPNPRDSSLTPATFRVFSQTPFGCSILRPLQFDGATIYVQQTKTALREYIYSEANARYASTNLNVLAGHLINDPIDMTVLYASQLRSEQYAIVVNGDGTMAVFHSSRAEQLAGWTPWSLGGEGNPKFSSIVAIGGVITVSVLRNGTYRLEQFQQTNAEPVDGGVAYTAGTAQTSWTVDSIFFNRTVDVVSGNYYMGSYVVGAAGELEIDEAVDNIVVGYGYDFEIETLPVEVQLQTGPTTGLIKRINKVIVGLDTTLALSISGTRLLLRQVTDDLSAEPAAVTGTREFRLLGYSRDATVRVEREEPLPCTVLGLTMEVHL